MSDDHNWWLDARDMNWEKIQWQTHVPECGISGLRLQGATDEFGVLRNHITPNTIKAAKYEIGAGIAISLNLEMNIPNPTLNPLRQATYATRLSAFKGSEGVNIVNVLCASKTLLGQSNQKTFGNQPDEDPVVHLCPADEKVQQREHEQS
ncbi:hypothetical protein K435DRAFT_801622 [Dendrothele bispora CBS 962.96]|uniref:Uncharacterized protein n=1 Tax=Dendrothele bispora (strain CBS 962.96) TaxID=1314807 RepID=A0A4S8LNR7_DENBC|nr:hypothetical protein K435DRAFT_801622 [Dendrothele bispora CBS 962.96]